MFSSIFLVLQGFYFGWAVTTGVDMIDTSDIWQFLLLFLPNAVLVVLYGLTEKMGV
jgi:hypothetical protein